MPELIENKPIYIISFLIKIYYKYLKEILILKTSSVKGLN